jgi:hypothetical protein
MSGPCSPNGGELPQLMRQPRFRSSKRATVPTQESGNPGYTTDLGLPSLAPRAVRARFELGD